MHTAGRRNTARGVQPIRATPGLALAPRAMTLRKRLFLTFGAITLLVLAPAVFALNRLSELRNIAFEQRSHHAFALAALGDLQASLAELDRYIRSYVATPGQSLQQGMHHSLARARAQLGNIREVGYDSVALPVAVRVDSLATRVRQIESLIAGDSASGATEVVSADVGPLLVRTQEGLDSIASAIDRRSGAEVSQAQRISETATSSMLFVSAIAFLLALGIAAWITRTLSGPLHRLRDATSEVAAGHFEMSRGLPYERRDEIGDLSRSFRTMTERLAELDRLKAEFVSVASHELKTPINVIGGYAELLEDAMYGPVSEEQREVLTRIREQTDTLTRQVNQLLDISRIEAGGFQVHPSEIQLDELINGIRRTFEPLADQKRIAFDVETGADMPDVIVADGDRLRNEVLGNLLSNAFKFTPEGGTIHVHAMRRDAGIRIDVADTGSGIPQDQLPFIFDKFYQVGAEARVKGSGLGLAIAREVVEAHSGDLSVDSRPGHGTVFHVDLPIDGTTPPEA